MIYIVEGKVNSNTKKCAVWMRDILDVLQPMCNTPVAIAVVQTRSNSKLAYSLENRKAKIHANIEKVGKTVELSLYERSYPDIEKCLIPDLRCVLDTHYTISSNNNKAIAEVLRQKLCVQNNYWHGKVDKTVVYSLPSVDHPLHGGMIMDLRGCENTTSVLTESGVTFEISKQLADLKGAAANKFIVIKSRTDFEIVSELDFLTYFKQA